MKKLLSLLRLRFAKLDFFACVLPEESAVAPVDSPDIVTARIEGSEAEALADYETGFLSRTEVKRRLESGEELLVTRVGGARACFCWIQKESFMLTFVDQRFNLPSDSAHIAFVFTKPEFRGRGLARRTLSNASRRLIERGFRRAFLEIEPDNTPSIRSALGAGFRKYASLTYLRLVIPRFYMIRSDSGKSWFFWRVRKTAAPELDDAVFGHCAGKAERFTVKS